jgi:heptaprenyl diphosphate synthase
MDEARAYVVERANEARELLTVLPPSPARDALDAFAALIATRTS